VNKPITPKKFATDLWDMMQMAIDEAVLAEREACAKVCETMARRTNDIRRAALEIAAENIRERGQA
tara:strand:+ start:289 stop:486 length:198 start_codon:yes stop_codon:yes gene_type:complete